MVWELCSFETDRLVVNEWHAWAKVDRSGTTLSQMVASIMTEPVTRSLPAHWHGAYDEERVKSWIAERVNDGPTLLVADRSTDEVVGLVILHEIESDEPGSVDVRLGYMLAESAWGKGLASELIGGLVNWCRAHGGVRSLSGGVAADNPASMRVLEKNDFRPVHGSASVPDEEIIYELMMR